MNTLYQDFSRKTINELGETEDLSDVEFG